MKIGFCQFAPKYKQSEENIATLSEWVDDIEPASLDILMFPEMCFTGCGFATKQDIEPLAESDSDGPILTFCGDTAKRLGCWVTAGYARKKNSDLLFNSMCVFDRNGDLQHSYDKHFLYETDENWATEGPSFTSIELGEFGRVGFGICMDLNPYRFQSSFWLYEFANFHLAQRSKLILCCMAWLRDKNTPSDLPSNMLPYWIERLRPLENSGAVVVICNRVGCEPAVQISDELTDKAPSNLEFCGHSCVIRFKATGVETTHCGEDEGLYTIEIDDM